MAPLIPRSCKRFARPSLVLTSGRTSNPQFLRRQGAVGWAWTPLSLVGLDLIMGIKLSAER